jgi:2-iminobutanoate/2-iminopropanoate deaminase
VIDKVSTERAPKAIGPYSQAVRANGFLFVSGQIPLDPKSQQVVGTTASVQTERVLENVKGILEAAGSALDRVVKATVYLADMNDFAAMNEVYSRYFEADPPARSTIEASKLPRNVRVEIDVIALL